jgi:hypothetical protein
MYIKHYIKNMKRRCARFAKADFYKRFLHSPISDVVCTAYKKIDLLSPKKRVEEEKNFTVVSLK